MRAKSHVTFDAVNEGSGKTESQWIWIGEKYVVTQPSNSTFHMGYYELVSNFGCQSE